MLVDSLGDWDLERLGASALELPTDGRSGERWVEFELPEGARQGPERWYLVRLRVTITVAARTRSGQVQVSVGTNEYAGGHRHLQSAGRATPWPVDRMDRRQPRHRGE